MEISLFLLTQDDPKAALSLWKQGDKKAALDLLTASLRTQSENWQCLLLLGWFLMKSNRNVEAISVLRRLEPLAKAIPDPLFADQVLADCYWMFGLCCFFTAELDEALYFLKKSIDRWGNRDFFIKYLNVLSYAPTADMTKLHHVAVEFHRQNQKASNIIPFIHSIKTQDKPDKCLRVGYFSAHFNWFQYMGFIHPILLTHDQTQFQPICLSLAESDEFSHIYAGRVDVIALHGLTPAQAAARIQELDIDILIDLVGVDSEGLFEILLYRPAKIQLVWQNSTGTTGNPAIDYSLGDALLIPPHHETFYTEKILRVPHPNIAYHPYIPLPTPTPPPYLVNGYISFGSLSLIYKINRQTVAIWAKTLAAVPNSRFVLCNPHLTDPALRAKIRNWFTQEGIAAERISMGGTEPGPAYLESYQYIDIALGTVPVNGGTTIVEALYTGIPILTLDWDVCLGLTGREILTAAGFQEWVCDGVENFIATAVSLAAAPEQLCVFRANAARILQEEKRFDTLTLVRDAEQIFRQIWQEWLHDKI